MGLHQLPPIPNLLPFLQHAQNTHGSQDSSHSEISPSPGNSVQSELELMTEPESPSKMFSQYINSQHSICGNPYASRCPTPEPCVVTSGNGDDNNMDGGGEITELRIWDTLPVINEEILLPLTSLPSTLQTPQLSQTD